MSALLTESELSDLKTTSSSTSKRKSSESDLDPEYFPAPNAQYCKKSKKSTSKLPQLPQQKKKTQRVSHSVIEKRRRVKMNQEFVNLKQLVPAFRTSLNNRYRSKSNSTTTVATDDKNVNHMEEKNGSSSNSVTGAGVYKLTILEETVSYIMYLHEFIMQMKNSKYVDDKMFDFSFLVDDRDEEDINMKETSTPVISMNSNNNQHDTETNYNNTSACTPVVLPTPEPSPNCKFMNSSIPAIQFEMLPEPALVSEPEKLEVHASEGLITRNQIMQQPANVPTSLSLQTSSILSLPNYSYLQFTHDQNELRNTIVNTFTRPTLPPIFSIRRTPQSSLPTIFPSSNYPEAGDAHDKQWDLGRETDATHALLSMKKFNRNSV